MLILLNIIFLFKFPLIFTSNLECKQINNCYECLNNPQCFILNNNCKNNENKPLKIENWYNRFDKYCIIENTENQQYCGLIEKSNKNVKIVKNNFFSKDNLFCKYNFNSDKINDKSIKIISNIYNPNINLIIEVQIDDNNKMIYNITEKNSISEKIKKFKIISIYYYHNNIPEKDDFHLEIQIKNKITYSDVVIFIFGCFGVIVIFLAIFLFIFIIKKLSKKKKNNKKVDIIPNDSNNNNENIFNNICKQTNKYKKKFILKRIKYNKSYILYNQKCPICIEEIKINDDVIILTCNHGFHMFCITEWIKKNIKKNRYCPICHLKFNQTKQNPNKIEEIKKENIIDNNKIINQEINENNKEYNEISPNSENSKNSNIIINSNNNVLNK